MLRYHDRATPHKLNNDGTMKMGNVYYQTEPIYHFFDRDLINDNASFYSHLLSAIALQCHIFPLEKLLLNGRLCL